jgi:HAD superfamily hydrolase (TIGR01509 family)
MIKHILFDCDGVLVDTEIKAAHVMVDAMQLKGANISVEHYLHHLTGSTFSEILDSYFGSSFNGIEKKKFINGLEKKIVKDAEAIAGVSKLLESISLPKSIVSNSEIWQVKEEIERTLISQHFTGRIFSSELVENPKPAPDVYNLAIKELGLKRNEILVIEDSTTGAKAALAAGLKVIGFSGASHILPGHNERLMALGVSEVASGMEELAVILDGFTTV